MILLYTLSTYAAGAYLTLLAMLLRDARLALRRKSMGMNPVGLYSGIDFVERPLLWPVVLGGWILTMIERTRSSK